jgi:putative hydrolase of the HAD superfamily
VSALPRREQLDAVLFDAGGTLIELDYAFIAARAAERARPLAPEALRRAEGRARRAIDAHAERAAGALAGDSVRRPGYFATLLEAAGLEGRARDAVIADLELEHARENLWRVEAPGAAAALSALRRRGLRLAVVSNADGRVERTLAAVGLTAELELVVDSHLEGVEKPDPAIFRRALERLRVRPERACYVGDIYAIDARGARAAGMAPVLIDAVGAYEELDCARVAHLDELVAGLGAGRER